MSRRNSQEPVALLTPEEQEAEREIKAEADIEADGGRVAGPKDQNLDHEYSIPSTVKFAWLGTYFFFSLLLTLYNKMVLGMVSSFTLPSPVSLIPVTASLPWPPSRRRAQRELHASTPRTSLNLRIC